MYLANRVLSDLSVIQDELPNKVLFQASLYFYSWSHIPTAIASAVVTSFQSSIIAQNDAAP